MSNQTSFLYYDVYYISGQVKCNLIPVNRGFVIASRPMSVIML